MRTRFAASIFCAAAVVAVVFIAPAPATAQSADAKAIPRLPDGKPDFNGVWDHPRVGDMTKNSNACASGTDGCKQVGMADLPYTPWGQDRFKTQHFDYTARCLPWGYTRSMGTEYPVELMQTSKRVGVLFESNNVYHVVPTDGRDHPKDLEPSWFGNSVGHYEGDTLVIDTIGFNEKTYVDTAEHPHSEQLHVTEKYSMIDANHLNYEVTIEDPKAYTKPWKNTRIFSRMKAGSELMEYVCMENNKELFEGHLGKDR